MLNVEVSMMCAKCLTKCMSGMLLQRYVKQGAIEFACEMFDEIPEKILVLVSCQMFDEMPEKISLPFLCSNTSLLPRVVECEPNDCLL